MILYRCNRGSKSVRDSTPCRLCQGAAAKEKGVKALSIASDLIRGHTDTIILANLINGDSYGYRINKSIQERTDGKYELMEATLYRVPQAGAKRLYPFLLGRRKYRSKTTVLFDYASWERNIQFSCKGLGERKAAH